MAHRFVRATPAQNIGELRERLEAGEIEEMEPFGNALTTALQHARFDPDHQAAVWVEEDYCSPPLAMERAEVLDEYFTEITVVEKNVDRASGWQRIEELPLLWDEILDTDPVTIDRKQG